MRMLSIPGGTVSGVTGKTTAFINNGMHDVHDQLQGTLQSHGYDGWSGRNVYKAREALITGDMSYVPRADAVLASIEGQLDYQSTRFRMVNSVVGGMPDIGAYLAGQPLNMRLRRRETDNQAPLVIALSVVTQSTMSAEDMVRRGVAVLALARLLEGSRPVTVYAVAGAGHGPRYRSGTHNTMQITPIDSQPLDLARACFALCDPAFGRALRFEVERRFLEPLGEYIGSVPFFTGLPTRTEEGAFARHVLNVAPENFLWIPAALTSDIMGRDPAAWVLKMAAKYGRADTVD